MNGHLVQACRRSDSTAVLLRTLCGFTLRNISNSRELSTYMRRVIVCLLCARVRVMLFVAVFSLLIFLSWNAVFMISNLHQRESLHQLLATCELKGSNFWLFFYHLASFISN